MTKTNRLALVRLARETIVASTSEAFTDLVVMGYAQALGLIVTPGAKRPTVMRAGYRITDKGKQRAAQLNEDGSPKGSPNG